jgi:hypothetical protein
MNEWMDIKGIFGVVATNCVFVTGHNDFAENSDFFFRVEVGSDGIDVGREVSVNVANLFIITKF